LVVGFIAMIGFTRRPGIVGLSPQAYWAGLLALSVIGVLTLIQYFRNWRCPECGAYLGGGSNPSRCPECGVQLRRENRDKP
jgi:tRNA(Ile2) C34 agmatinyltransferase TiaS